MISVMRALVMTSVVLRLVRNCLCIIIIIISLCRHAASNYLVIHSFISGMHHYECVVPNVDINLRSGQF